MSDKLARLRKPVDLHAPGAVEALLAFHAANFGSARMEDPADGGDGGSDNGGDGRTFTQADLDRVVSERLARESKKFADYDDLKAKASQLDEMTAAQQSDHEKALEEARKGITAELTATHLRERVADKVEIAAAGRFADVADARLRLADRFEEFIADGAVDSAAITKAVDELLEKAPHLKAAAVTQTPSASDVGLGVSGSNTREVAPGFDRLRGAYAAGAK